jgi:2-hydroxy-3-keto-5-methylthiopentenyl-1-phosphate phosphatase
MLTGEIPMVNGAPSSEGVSKAFLEEVNSQMAALMEGVGRLEAKVQAKADATAGQPKTITLEGMQDFLKNESDKAKNSSGTASDLTALPKAFDENVVILTEWDELCMSGDMERALLGDAKAAAVAESASARTEALEELRMSLDDTIAALATAGVRIRDEFIDFAEACAMRRVRLVVLSKSLKPLVRQLLREQGLGHVEVLAHDMMVEPSTQQWKISLNNEGWKAEALRRCLQNARAKPSAVVQVGRCACDLPVATGGRITGLLVPVGSELAHLAAQSGVRHREFGGWQALGDLVMGHGSEERLPVADGTDLADLD